MSFSLLATMRRLLAPQHELSCASAVWRRLLTALRERGRGASRESGAFLLGHSESGRRRVVDFILYDDLDAHCLDAGIVNFDGRYFGELWRRCAQRGVTVVADVHVHPGSEWQSPSDRAHPMIAAAGHIALIVPRYAASPLGRADVGIYRYEGAKRWMSVPRKDRRKFFLIGWAP